MANISTLTFCALVSTFAFLDQMPAEASWLLWWNSRPHLKRKESRALFSLFCSLLGASKQDFGPKIRWRGWAPPSDDPVARSNALPRLASCTSRSPFQVVEILGIEIFIIDLSSLFMIRKIMDCWWKSWYDSCWHIDKNYLALVSNVCAVSWPIYFS